MGQYKIFVLGTFQGVKKQEIQDLLAGFPNVDVVQDTSSMNLLLASAQDIRASKKKKANAWKSAIKNGVPIVGEEWVQEMRKEFKWSDPAEYLVSGTIQTLDDGDLVDDDLTVPPVNDGINHLNDSTADEVPQTENSTSTDRTQHSETAVKNSGVEEKYKEPRAATVEKDDEDEPRRDGSAVDNEGLLEDKSKEPQASDDTNKEPQASDDNHFREIKTEPDLTPAPQVDVSGWLTTDRYSNVQIPAWARISIPAEKRPEGISATGVIECVVTGGFLVVSELTPKGCRRGYLLSGRDHGLEKHRFSKKNREVLSNEVLTDWKGKGYVLGSDIFLDLVAQSTAKTIAIAFLPEDRRPLLFTATMVVSIWGKSGRMMMEKVMENAQQGPFRTRAEMHVASRVDTASQDTYLRMRSRAVSEEMAAREHLEEDGPHGDSIQLPLQRVKKESVNDGLAEELKKALGIIRGLSKEQLEEIIEID